MKSKSFSSLLWAAVALLICGASVSQSSVNNTKGSSPVEDANGDDRCRDCVFPFKIDDNHWQMPDSDIVVQIEEEVLQNGDRLMLVTLRDKNTREMIAAGSALRKKNQRSVLLLMTDREGRRVKGQILWVNFKEQIIRAKFTCELTCSLP
jgi:hypothetical protein